MKTAHVAIAGVAGSLLMVGVVWAFLHRPIAFDAEIWSRGDSEPFKSNSSRERMADQLVSSGVLIGKAKTEVLTMLGPPTPTDKFSNHGLIYWLGAERGLISIDSEWLAVDFDSNGQAIKASIVRD